MHVINELSAGTKWAYRGWKIFKLSDGSFEAVRVRPTKYFRGTTNFQAVILSIDRREDFGDLSDGTIVPVLPDIN